MDISYKGLSANLVAIIQGTISPPGSKSRRDYIDCLLKAGILRFDPDQSAGNNSSATSLKRNPPKARGACAFLGEQVSQIGCSGCGGRAVVLTIFECKHPSGIEECLPHMSSREQVQGCETCHYFTEKQQ